MDTRTKFLLALKNNHHQAIGRLVNEIDLTKEIENNKTPIALALDLNMWDCIDAIVRNKKAGLNDKFQYGKALVAAVELGRLDSAKMLLEAGAASKDWWITANGDRCLHVAVRKRNIAMIALLKSFDFPMNKENDAKKTPLLLAYELGYEDCADALNGKYGNALLDAVAKGQLDVVKILLGAGVPRDVRNSEDDSCLHIAIKKCNIAMIELLLSFNVSLTIEDAKKHTPIQTAAYLNNWDCVDAIAKKKKADLKDEARYGDALYCAAFHNKIDSARTLLEAGASKNWHETATSNGCLHHAVIQKNKLMVALLLSFGFNLNETNLKNQTPQQLAESLKVDTFYEGWKKYFHEETLLVNNALTVLAQGYRRENSVFHRMPSAVLEYILPFLSREVLKHTDTIDNKLNTFAKVSKHSFLNASAKRGVFESEQEAKKVLQMK